MYNATLNALRRPCGGDESAGQRRAEFVGGEAGNTSATTHQLAEHSSAMEGEFYDFYCTPRGEYTPAGTTSELTTNPASTCSVTSINLCPLIDIKTISPRPLLFIAGERPSSRSFDEPAYLPAAEPIGLVVFRGAGHVDSFERVNLAPLEEATYFSTASVKSSQLSLPTLRSGSN